MMLLFSHESLEGSGDSLFNKMNASSQNGIVRNIRMTSSCLDYMELDII